MARGFARGVYVTDQLVSYALQVDADYAEDPCRGWTLDTDGSLPLLPRAFLPRRVVGLDDVGRQVTAVAPTTDAPIWTGACATFVFEANDNTLMTATIVARLEERARPSARFA